MHAQSNRVQLVVSWEQDVHGWTCKSHLDPDRHSRRVVATWISTARRRGAHSFGLGRRGRSPRHQFADGPRRSSLRHLRCALAADRAAWASGIQGAKALDRIRCA